MARGDNHPEQVTEISNLLLKNFSVVSDIIFDYHFMTWFIYIISHINAQDIKKWLDLLSSITEELRTNPEQKRILKQYLILMVRHRETCKNQNVYTESRKVFPNHQRILMVLKHSGV